MAGPLQQHYHWSPQVAATGLTLAAALAAWLEMTLLARVLEARIGVIPKDRPCELRILLAALAAGAAAFGLHRFLHGASPVLDGIATAGVFGAVYLALTLALGVPQARDMLRRVRLAK